ncbi:kinesin-like protein KIN-14J [Typha angustifolia]|uniref:kinesin-like protein KIN-14J n=1 Tax=Typha angustifolia TaxID=59011 RepID=UPI003C2CAD42
MGEEGLLSSSPMQEKGQALQESKEDRVQEDGYPSSEMETIEDKDDEAKPNEEDSDRFIQIINDDCLIPSPMLKGIGGPNLSSSLQLLGTKYNGLMKRHEVQTSENEALRASCEALTKKCSEECGPRYETLKKKYTEECSERKRLYNELIEMRGNIRVFCRCRPLSSKEVSGGHTSVIDFDPSQDTELQIICSDASKKQFKFDHIFGPTDDQEAVFAETLPVVRSVLDGYNVCIFAYGQTGTGKTFTMEGTPENRGVNYRALEVLFRISQERCSSVRYEFSVSMLEVYNEKLRDLLEENSDQLAKKLEIKQAADGAQEVPGLVEAQVCNIEEVWKMLKTGARNRSVGSTNANELSSRSHCLVRVTIKSENLVNGQRNRSHMWLVDLAGSERLGKIEVEGERLKESQFINKSLSALGDVISALASKNPHIPYRNSKLTHLLQSSLGGDCKTLMFAQISPSSADLGETICTLNFASRVRGIEHGPARKQSDPAESFKLKQMVDKLRQEEKETARLNESLQLMHLKYASRENVFKILQEKIRDAEQTCRNYQQRVRDLENQLADEKKASRDAAKFSKPPLAPLKERPPLGRITNRLPTSGPQRRSSISKITPLQNKENVLPIIKSSGNDVTRSVGKARRISLATFVRPGQPKRRRASIAILPSGKETQLVLPEQQLVHQLSHLRGPRRRSVAAFNSIPGTPLATAAPDGNAKFRGIESSSSKYGSPRNMVQLWKSKIPTISSPRQRLRLISSPANPSNLRDAQQAPSKLCFSVQKRITVSTPVQSNKVMFSGSGIFNQALRMKETAGRSNVDRNLDAAATPDGKGKIRSMESNSNYYASSPAHMLPLWKSKIPTISSPRQRLRLISSPANISSLNDSEQAPSKLCFSVQKRVVVSPSAQLNNPMLSGAGIFSHALREKGAIGRWGTAQRVMCTNRRKSVI